MACLWWIKIIIFHINSACFIHQQWVWPKKGSPFATATTNTTTATTMILATVVKDHNAKPAPYTSIIKVCGGAL